MILALRLLAGSNHLMPLTRPTPRQSSLKPPVTAWGATAPFAFSATNGDLLGELRQVGRLQRLSDEHRDRPDESVNAV